MHTIFRDVRYALRQLRKAPGFTGTAVLTLALGMGATMAIYSLIRGALRLPFPEASRMVSVKNRYPTASYLAVSYPDFEEWKRENKSFTRMVAIFPARKTYLGGREPVDLSVSYVSEGFFETFGLKPVAGRGFLASEERKGAAPVCVLSQSFWQEEFGGSRAALGRSLVLNGTSYTVVGVVPEMVPSFFRKAQVWVPLEAAPPYDQHGTNYLEATGVLKPGISMQQAQSDLAVIQSQIDKQFPDNRHGVELQTLAETLFGDVHSVMLILFAAVGFILLIACVNLANMMLSRATERMREFGIRQALGASPRRLLQQSFMESGLLAVAGGLVGLAIAVVATKVPVRAWPKFLVAPADVHLDAAVLCFAGALVILTTVIFGSLPAFQIVRQSARHSVQQDLRTMSESREQRLVRSGLMVAEVAFATLLVGGALSMAFYFARLMRIDPGMRTDHVLNMDVALSPTRYAKDEDQRRLFHALVEKLDAVPGVMSAGGVSVAPFSGNAQSSSFTYEGESDAAKDPSRMQFADAYFVTPGYLETMQIPLRQGRLLTAEDSATSRSVLVINQAMAQKLWPGQSAIGKHIEILPGRGKEKIGQEVVGVVGNVRNGGVAHPAGLQVYASTEQYPMAQLSLVMRTRGEPLEIAEEAKAAVHGLDPEVLITNLSPVDGLAAESMAGESTSTMLMSALGVLALLLASVGVYGVMAYAVAKRQREFGIRLALGARRGQIYAMLLRSTGARVVVGLTMGWLLSLPLNGWMMSLLGGAIRFEPAAFVATAALLGAVALAAALIPSRRAASVDPMQSLRME